MCFIFGGIEMLASVVESGLLLYAGVTLLQGADLKLEIL